MAMPHAKDLGPRMREIGPRVRKAASEAGPAIAKRATLARKRVRLRGSMGIAALLVAIYLLVTFPDSILPLLNRDVDPLRELRAVAAEPLPGSRTLPPLPVDADARALALAIRDLRASVDGLSTVIVIGLRVLLELDAALRSLTFNVFSLGKIVLFAVKAVVATAVLGFLVWIARWSIRAVRNLAQDARVVFVAAEEQEGDAPPAA